jgi:hypothetical protein
MGSTVLGELEDIRFWGWEKEGWKERRETDGKKERKK